MSTDRSDGQRRDDDPQASTPTAERLRVARVGKPHGVRGEVTVQLFTDDPEHRLAPGAELLRTPGQHTPDRETSTLTVTSRRWKKAICLLGFAEVDGRDAAEALRGSMLHVEVPAETEDPDEGWYSHQIAGFACVDAEGTTLGRVLHLVTGAAQDLLVVVDESGEETMVPFVEELVPEVDAARRVVTLDPPDGLFPA